ncbi:unnamed protein product, partial [Durusdinium trenchii]
VTHQRLALPRAVLLVVLLRGFLRDVAWLVRMEPKGFAAVAVLSLGAVVLLAVALLCPGVWGRASASPPRAQHHLVAEYDLWQARLEVLFYPDPALPWKQAPPPLHIPPVPLYHFVHGPAAVARLGRRASDDARSPVAWDGDELEMRRAALQDWDYEQQAATWLALTLRRNRKRNTTWTWQSTLPVAADAVEQRCGIGIALQIGSLIVQASGARRLARGANAKALYGAALVLQVCVTAATLFAFVGYLSRFHNKLHMLAAEFVFAQTDGAIVIWPADFKLQLGPCAISVALSGLLALAASLLLAGLLVRARSPKQDPADADAVRRSASSRRFTRSKSSTLVAAELLFEASVIKLKSHDRRVVCIVLLAMTLLALLLGLMAFLLGRAGVEDGVSKAFRGPEDSLRKTSRAAQAVSHLIGRSTRCVVLGPARVVLGLVHHAAGAVASLGHVVALPISPILRALRRVLSFATKGVVRGATWLAAVADAAAKSAQANQDGRAAQAAEVVPTERPKRSRFRNPFLRDES